MSAAGLLNRVRSPPPSTGAAGSDPLSVVIAHDYLNQRGGAERVVLEMADMWPAAPIYTSLYRPESTFPEFRQHDIRCSFLDRAPVDRHFRGLFPLYPLAFRRFGELDADVVLSSSSGWAHMVRASPSSFHVVYCYTPARWLWSDEYLGAGSLKYLAFRPVRAKLRRLDEAAARRADLYIAISDTIRQRIRAVYGIDAPVVAPPVSVDRFSPRLRGERLLVVSRLLAYKRVDIAVNAATQLGIGLDVVGVGPALEGLRASAGPTVQFHGELTDAAVVELMESCRALCFPGSEDFGITPVEAQAAGKPVIAFAGGGALDTVVEGVTGAFFKQPSVESFIGALARCDQIDTAPEEIALASRRFAPGAFRAKLTQEIAQGRQRHLEQTGSKPLPASTSRA
jgi:glycosyltransferase involved in cell wall biosynthesis